MTHEENPKSDPLLAKFSTTVCKKMASKQIDLLRKEKFPLNYGDKAEKVSNTLTQCLETNTNPNFDAIAPIERNISTEEPLLSDTVVTENYDNYVDFNENYYENLENVSCCLFLFVHFVIIVPQLKEATFNIINATSMSAKVLALTTAVGEKFIEVFGKKSATVVAKDEGEVLAESKVRSQGVTLIPSPDFAGDDHTFDILMSTWSNDILWWNRAKTKVATDIASIEFWHSTCKQRISNFNEPAQLIFKIKDDVKDKVIFNEETFLIPEEYEQLFGEDLSRLIKVKRIALPKKWLLQIHLLQLDETDALDVKFALIITDRSLISVSIGGDHQL